MIFQKKGLLVVVFLFFLTVFSKAQLRDRIYIQLDRSGYVAGETIWLKVYLLSALTPGSAGSNLLLDMVDESGKRIVSGSLPVLGGIAIGNLDLPTGLSQGVYFIRAYTKTQPAKDEYSSAMKTVYVFNPSSPTSVQASGSISDYQCIFKPSSGNLVVGSVNIVYVNARDLLGKPATVEGTVVNAKNEVSVGFKTDADGLGRFALSPMPGELYKASIRFADGTTKSFDLPKPDDSKVLVSVTDVPRGKLFNVVIPETARNGSAMKIRGFMDDNLVFEKNFTATVDHVSARIPVDELPAGLLQFIVTDAKKQKLGEAISLVNGDSSLLPVQFNVDTLSLSPGGKNVFSLRLPEDIAGSFSVSITDHDKTLYTNENNIVTGLLLSQDSRNHSLVSNKTISGIAGKEAIELVLGTADWQDQSMHTGENHAPNDSDFITIRGKIFNKDNKKPITKGDISVIYTTKDSVTAMLSASLATDGSFSLPQLIFEGKQMFRFSVNGNKWTDIAASVDSTKPEDAFPLPFTHPGVSVDKSYFTDAVVVKQAKETYTTILADSVSSTGLKAVTVTARKVSPKQQVNDRYTRGVFTSMGAAKTLDLINESNVGAGNILDHLQGRIAGLLITSGGGEYSIASNRQLSLNLMPPVRLFLDESPTTIGFLSTVRAKDVALVKYYPPGMGGAIAGVGIGAALVVYTKKPSDGGTTNYGSMSQFLHTGYLPAKDFSYDYLQKNGAAVGQRATVYWNPYLQPEEGKPVYKIRFTNSDTAKKLHVVVEGFTTDGKLLHFEKLIE